MTKTRQPSGSACDHEWRKEYDSTGGCVPGGTHTWAVWRCLNCGEETGTEAAVNEIRQSLASASLEELEAANNLPLSEVLRQHWLTGIECDHEAKTDVATCFCSVWRSEPQPSVGQAVERWIEHVMAATPSTGAPDAAPEKSPAPAPALQEEGVRRGMEEAAKLIDREANATDSLIEEAPAHTKIRLTAARDALSAMAQSVRKAAQA